jgi:hypothetical protein
VQPRALKCEIGVFRSDVLPTAWQAVEYADVPGFCKAASR